MINNGDNITSIIFPPQIIFNSIFSHASILTLSITNCHIYSIFVILNHSVYIFLTKTT
ncbi:hypothetical protein XD13_12590 [Staphylococcus aureus]|nr:hypothetical protein AB525_12900 [Staphylococcus aureus]OHP79324.1 hypothetical protein HMPREF2658_12300 [Staphylococcus sp. HMSC062H10]KIT60396.1 hypothetical protein QP65_13520 [Staphylococcus aureus]KXJ34120.1 hypothetical protein AX283_12120 [Staphylococcus aureus]MCD4650077.1 hypothetical protein [Staphylococcus aureus]